MPPSLSPETKRGEDLRENGLDQRRRGKRPRTITNKVEGERRERDRAKGEKELAEDNKVNGEEEEKPHTLREEDYW